MISVDEAIDKFKTIISADPSWSNLTNSQFAEHIAIFMAWALRDAQFKAERDRQELFLSTAINRASIQAHAEDREYIPIKPIPSSGTILATNSGVEDIAVAAGTEFFTTTDTIITTTTAAVIPANGSVSIAAEQKELVTYTYPVNSSIEFFECLIPLEKTALVASFTVKVTDPFGELDTYSYYRLLQNTYPTTKAYDEFYSHNGQIGVRFGNGNFGYVPLAGSTVTIKTWETKGDVYISSGQKLYPVEALTTLDVLKFTVSTAFSGGSNAEDTDSIRTNLHYWQTYNEELIWAEDYEYFLKRKFPDLVFAKAWGEGEMETQEGAPSLDYVNRIYISAYEPGNDRHLEYLSSLNAVKPLNRTFVWVPVNHIQWTISLTGTVLDDVSLTNAEVAISAVLEDAYGKDSVNRKKNVFTSEIYDLIMGTGYFDSGSGARFTLTTSGSTAPTLLQDMVSINLAGSTINLSYA